MGTRIVLLVLFLASLADRLSGGARRAPFIVPRPKEMHLREEAIMRMLLAQ
jgi:hypothetical protein